MACFSVNHIIDPISSLVWLPFLVASALSALTLNFVAADRANVMICGKWFGLLVSFTCPFQVISHVERAVRSVL